MEIIITNMIKNLNLNKLLLNMFIQFEEEEIISYPYKPITITYQKRSYLIVPDFFKKISKSYI